MCNLYLVVETKLQVAGRLLGTVSLTWQSGLLRRGQRVAEPRRALGALSSEEYSMCEALSQTGGRDGDWLPKESTD